MSHQVKLGVVPAYLLLCLLLGGASAAGLMANMILQLLALPIIFWALTIRRGSPTPASGRQLMLLLVLMLLVVAVQLIPLPPGVWTALPGRDSIARGYAMLNIPLPWLPISLAPQNTLASGLWLLPAVAVTLGIIRLGGFKSGWLAWVIVIATAAAVMAGALQVAGGAGSPWYFYRITNYGQNVGFFANANHMATLMVVTLPFLAALYIGARRKRRSAQHATGLLVIVFGAVGVVLVGILINGSRAGWGLTVPAATASLLMVWARKRSLPIWAWLGLAALASAAAALAFTAPSASDLAAADLQQETQGSRARSFTLSSEAAADMMPVGSGLGTFRDIYEMYEDPAKISRFYMNHVHNDYIEIALETGVLGLLVLALFLLWWVRRLIAVWSAEEPDHFARAASIASGIILVHSLVDYPLRTAALSAVFAMCCALMSEPRARAKATAPAEGDKQVKHLSAD